ncbi:ATP-binding cassette domain-containing protein [Magnetovibrio sp.]|uniref:ATP-binding cassette domain-containing protein n=1 Tax=Magnetovibrio sp. TaxID=2024836 RepID=UPI002F947D87
MTGETALDPSTEPSAKSWLKPFLKPLTPVFREVVAMSFFVNLLALAVPVFTMQVYNRVVNSNGISTLQGLVVGMFLVIAFDYVLRQSRARILQTVALRVDVDLGRRLFRKIMRMPLQNLEAQPSAYWSSLFRDVDVVRNTLSGSTALLVADLPFAILFLILIFVIAAPVAWVLLVMLPVFMFIAWRSSNVMSDASGQERKSTQTRDSLVGEMIAGRTTIKALGLDRSMEPVWEEKHAENIESAINRGSKTDGFSNLGASLGLITSLLLTTVGALAIIDQNLTIGALIATNMLSGRIMGPLNQLVGTWRLYAGFNQATERLGTVFLNTSEREVSEVKLEKPKGALSIENVFFSYGEDQAPVVSGITVEIQPGGVHALVGRNGSGKTTLLKIIQGLYQPHKGRVTLDGADMAQFTRSELADWLGYVPQESVLFAGTVRDNITSRKPDASDEEVIKAATEAGVHEFIIDLPDGYATEIGEAGGRLSGGQRQRIAIARALVGDPPVVLLDEPSSSLDRHAETELKNTLIEIAKTRTVIMVSHSPTLLSACDYLYALDRGKLALAGPAREVLPRLFGGKAPPPKGDGPTPATPGPGKGKSAPAASPASGKATAQAAASTAPAVQSTPETPLQKLADNAIAAGASASADLAKASTKPAVKASAPPQAATPKRQVKAAATPRGKAPSVARSQDLARAVKPTAATQARKSKATPRSVPNLRSRQEASSISLEGVKPATSATVRSPAATSKTLPKATPHVRPPAPKANASVQLRGKERPHTRVGKTKTPSLSSASKSAPPTVPSGANPTVRGPKLVRALPNLDPHAGNSAPRAEASAKKHPKIKTGATLRPTTQSILKEWSEGSGSITSLRNDTKGRGVGARARSTPSLRSKGPVGE